MSLDITFTAVRPKEVYWGNITHNLGGMARAAGIYECLWRPEEVGITRAQEMITALEAGLADLEARPEHFKTFDAANGWGTYLDFVRFVREVLDAARANPDAEVHACR